MSYAPASIETARDHIAKLLDGFAAATGFPRTFVSKLARGEAKFGRIYQTIDFGFRSYDIVNSRLSALWPSDAPWPAGVPRQAPAKIEPDVLAAVAARLEKPAHAAKTSTKEADHG